MWYYFSRDFVDHPRINLGRWKGKEPYLNYTYNDFIKRLVKFVLSDGEDRYQRCFLAEPVINFALDRDIANCSIHYIYRHYVYNKLSEYEPLDVESAYIDDLLAEFVVISEKDIDIK